MLSFRCLPTDIDFNLHLNNARYLMLADLGRVDIFLRSGLFALMRRKNWSPMLGGVQTAFVREVRLWQRFHVESSIETWEGTQVIGRHTFVHENGESAAVVLTTAGVYDRSARRFLPIDEVIALLGIDAAARSPSEAEKAFMASHTGLRTLAKLRSRGLVGSETGREPAAGFYARLTEDGGDIDLEEAIKDRTPHKGPDL